jgi:hypothetical protein
LTRPPQRADDIPSQHVFPFPACAHTIDTALSGAYLSRAHSHALWKRRGGDARSGAVSSGAGSMIMRDQLPDASAIPTLAAFMLSLRQADALASLEGHLGAQRSTEGKVRRCPG